MWFLLLLFLTCTNATLPKKRKVLMIGVDGMRPDVMLYSRDTPVIDQLIQDGEWSFHSQVEVPISGSSWSNIFTGKSTFGHGVLSNTFSGYLNGNLDESGIPKFSFKNNAPSLFNLIEEEGLTFACRTSGGWDGIYKICATAGGENHKNIWFEGAGDEGEARSAEEATQNVIEMLAEEETPDLVLWYSHAVDASGHRHGFSITNDNYMKQIKETDVRIGSLIEAVRARPDDEEWLVLLTTDHGGTMATDVSEAVLRQFANYQRPQAGIDQSKLGGFHGLNTPSHSTNFLILAEPKNVDSPVYLRTGGGELFPPPLNVDVTPTILDFLRKGMRSGGALSESLKKEWETGFVGVARGGPNLFSGIRAARATNIRDKETYFHLWSETPIECVSTTNEDEVVCRGAAGGKDGEKKNDIKGNRLKLESLTQEQVICLVVISFVTGMLATVLYMKKYQKTEKNVPFFLVEDDEKCNFLNKI
eukprot:g3409.t1